MGLHLISSPESLAVCGSTWDLICYIENFCIANLLKLATVSFLFYIVLLFFYLSYQLGIFHCICGTLCRMVWACVAACFSVCVHGCYFLGYELHKVKRKRRRRRRRDIEELTSTTSEEEEEDDAASVSYHNIPRRSSVSRRWRDYKGDQLRRSLRPRSHRVRVRISGGDLFHVRRRRNRIKRGDHGSTIHDIRVTQTSKFAQKGTNYKGSRHRRRMH